MCSRLVTVCVFILVLLLKVEVENDCTEISPNQEVKVMVKTVPSYCGLTWTGNYKAPGKNMYMFAQLWKCTLRLTLLLTGNKVSEAVMHSWHKVIEECYVNH